MHNKLCNRSDANMTSKLAYLDMIDSDIPVTISFTCVYPLNFIYKLANKFINHLDCVHYCAYTKNECSILDLRD